MSLKNSTVTKPEIKIIKDIDTSDKWWCDSAVLFSVKNGKNTICELSGQEDDDYEYNLQMRMDGVPLVQGHFPCCPTCKGMLAAGYGIENVDSPEFEAARNCMNSAFISVWDSAEKIKPLLGLLGDGLYALADVLCFPSDGDGHFFYDVSSELRYYDAACYGYYCNWDYSCSDHFPLFLYPTQSASLINKERVEYYAQIMRTEKNPPRALAYHLYGFMNVLLDGHHKACAAASLGKVIRCLTIIPCDGSEIDMSTVVRGVNYKVSNPGIKTLSFAGLKTDAEKGTRYLDIYREDNRGAEVEIKHYPVTDAKIHYGPDTYPTIRDLAALFNAGEKIKRLLPDFDPEVISGLTYDDTDETDRFLEAIIHFLAAIDQDSAYKAACSIVKKGDGFMRHRRVKASLLFLLNYRDEETEQIFVDFYLAHEEHDENWNIANSYWKDRKD